jgi:hypothetical protein
VAGGAAQVEQAALGEHDDAVAVGEDEAVALGLDVLALDALVVVLVGGAVWRRAAVWCVSTCGLA